MKHLLKESFFLNEKYELNETFILIEDERDVQDGVNYKYSAIDAAKNWSAELKAAGFDRNKIKEVLEEYYKTEWPDGRMQTKIRSLGSGFIQELVEFGFDDVANPFLAFLHYDDNRAVKEFDLNSKTWGVIHNAYVDRLIDGSDLRGTGAMKTDCILFCKDLYAKQNPTIMTEYLELHSALLGRSSSGKYRFQKNLDDSQYKPSANTYYCAIMYAGGNASEVSSKNSQHKRKSVRNQKVDKNTLKTFEDAKNDASQLLGNAGNDTVVFKPESFVEWTGDDYHIKQFCAFCYTMIAKDKMKVNQILDELKKANISTSDPDFNLKPETSARLAPQIAATNMTEGNIVKYLHDMLVQAGKIKEEQK